MNTILNNRIIHSADTDINVYQSNYFGSNIKCQFLFHVLFINIEI